MDTWDVLATSESTKGDERVEDWMIKDPDGLTLTSLLGSGRRSRLPGWMVLKSKCEEDGGVEMKHTQRNRRGRLNINVLLISSPTLSCFRPFFSVY